MEKKKEYKPGQIVTINGKIYRIKKHNGPTYITVCGRICGFIPSYNGICCFCVNRLSGPQMYLERITPKTPKE